MAADVRPPYDPELEAALAVIGDQLPSTVTPDMIEMMRGVPVTVPIEDLLKGQNITHREVTIPATRAST